LSETIDRLTQALADRYRLDRELGEGGMATVYLAQDLKHDRRVAVKVLRPELAAVIGAERFLQEIKTTANLQHPHILPLHDSGEAGGTVFYVMPYVEGESLRDRLAREKQLPVTDAVQIATEVASALDYAHRHGVIHRDIKPENVLLHEGRALVADFGIALAVSRSEGGTRLTETGMSLGTPHYMSPEQAMGERELDARSDVYSLAAMLYEMLAGEPPYTGATAQAIVARVLTEEPRPLTVQRRTVPSHVEAAVRQALSKLPADRFGSAAEFSTALTDPRYTAPGAAAGAAGEPRAVLPSYRRTILALAVVALVSTALATWSWLRRASPPPVSRYNIALAEGQALQPGQGPRIALSPDGSRFVYVGPGEGGGQLWVRERDQLSARPLAGTEGAISPFVSPDGRRVGFYTITPMRLKAVSLSGEPPVTVADSGVDWDGGAWGADGYIYSDTPTGLARVRPGGGPLERVTQLDSARGESAHNYPDVLPNGKGAVFTVWHTGGLGDHEIAVVDFRTGRHHILATGVYARYAAAGYLVYATATGTLLAAPFDQTTMELTGEATALAEGIGIRSFGYVDLAISATGTLLYVGGGGAASMADLVWVSRGGDVTVIDSNTYEAPVLSPDGRRVAAAITSTGEQQVWIRLLPDGPSSKLTFEGGTNARPFWSPDGGSVGFFSTRTGVRSLFVQRADGSAPAQPLLRLPTELLEGEWSQDGRWLLVRTGAVPGADVMAVRTSGDTTPIPLVASQFSERSPTLSPDTRWLAYTSDESGSNEVYVRPFPDAARAKWQVSIGGGTEPLWAHSGKELFYRNGAGDMVATEIATDPTFAVRHQAVLFEASPYVADDSHRGYDISPDDTRFLMVRERGGGERASLIVVENWFEELRTKFGGKR
jgi:Tol biopolymer transport system component/tRNA A-37 threonylcarbamoyl transferase component Bud32